MQCPHWTILIPTIGRRVNQFERLVTGLLKQTEKYDNAVQILAFYNNGQLPLYQIRQSLVDQAEGDYISFIDDDDEVSEYYVDTIFPLLDGVDYIGWRMQCIMDGTTLSPTYHSLRYNGWSDDADGYYRDISHLNPIKRELVIKYAKFGGTIPEDVDWASQLRNHVTTEHYISDIMYFYYASSGQSTWKPGTVKSVEAAKHVRKEIVHQNFKYHTESMT